MPDFMKFLHNEITQANCSLVTKVFILKVVTNNSKVFEPYADFWFRPIAEYLAAKETGGKGFHYFARDLCTMLVSWASFTPKDT